MEQRQRSYDRRVGKTPELIDLDVPSARPQQSMPRYIGHRRRLMSAKISVMAALGIMVASGAVSGALSTYVARKDVRVVAIPVNIVPDALPNVTVAENRVHLDGKLTISNLGASPITVASLRFDAAGAQINGSVSKDTVDPGTSLNISITLTLVCTKGPAPKLNTKASVVVKVLPEFTDSEASIAFEYGRWGEQMLLACLTSPLR